MPLTLSTFNTAGADELRPTLAACLDVARWADDLLAARPYADLEALLQAAAKTTLRPDEVRTAMAAHPRIGERPKGTGTDAGWSRSEQSGVDNADAFAEANIEYEAQFGHVFLVCAGGRSGGELLTNLKERLANDAGTELAVAGRELVKIAGLRLQKAVAE